MDRLIKVIGETTAHIAIESMFVMPFIFLSLFGIIMAAIYLPERAVLQYATQTAATALVAGESSTWLRINEQTGNLELISDKTNVYVDFFRSIIWTRNRRDQMERQVTSMVEELTNNTWHITGLLDGVGPVEVTLETRNWVVYQEVRVTASRFIDVPFRIPLIDFPLGITLTYSSTAVVNNGASFVRTVDMVVDLVRFISESVMSNLRQTSQDRNES